MGDSAKRHKNFRKLLQRISKNLKHDTVKEMMNMVVGIEGYPGHKDVENVKSGMDFFLKLEEHGQLSPDNFEELVELLNDVNRKDLVKILEYASGKKNIR